MKLFQRESVSEKLRERYFLNLLGGDELFESLSFANHPALRAIDENFGRQRLRVVGGSHGEAVGSGAHHSDNVSWLEARNFPVLAEKVTRFANWPNHVDDLSLASGLLDRIDLVIALIQSRADELVHSRIDDLESFGGTLLFVKALC